MGWICLVVVVINYRLFCFSKELNNCNKFHLLSNMVGLMPFHVMLYSATIPDQMIFTNCSMEFTLMCSVKFHTNIKILMCWEVFLVMLQ